MNKAKYFRVKKIVTRNGETIYKVQSADNIFEFIFNIWDEYKKDNDTLDEAVKQIETINKYKIEDEKVVYKKTLK